MKIKEITSFLESIAPLHYQESYDNSGLIVGNPDAEISKALICLDSTEQIIDEAIKQKCGLVIAHHPIVFSGLKKLNGKNYIERTIIKAIQNNIAIYAIHTNLDNMHDGVNDMIARKLALEDTYVLQPKKDMLKKLVVFVPVNDINKVSTAIHDAGAGHIGNYSHTGFNSLGIGTFMGNDASNPTIGKKGDLEEVTEFKFETVFPAHLETKVLKAMFESHPYEEVAYDIISLDNLTDTIGAGKIGKLPKPVKSMEFLKYIKKSLNTDCIRYTAIHKDTIQKVAVCGGSGSFLLNDAIRQNADVFITADFKYHQFFDAENKIIIADIGHYESEQFTKELIFELLQQKFPNFALHFSETNTNPIKYL
jgi:dinuclear metal center YbgI/SA1388 family protein